jgi:hypothetical protein
MYGTQPVQSPLFAGGASRENITGAVNSWIANNPGADINTVLAAMRGSGINRTDIQAAGGVNNYGPQMSMPSMQTQQPFNPYTNNFGYGSGSMPQMQNPFSQPAQQMQSPFSYQQPMQQMQSPFSYQQPSAMTPRAPVQPPIQNPFSYRQPSYGPSQLPSYVYDTIRGLDQYQSQPVQTYQPTTQPATQPYQAPAVKSSGPSQAIIGRSSQMRGTPNVMRRAGGGIMSLMDDE